MGTSNRRCTAPTSKRDPFAVTPAAISVFPARKKISLPSRRHRALSPPAVEIRTFPPGPGNGTTYTSDRPDSFELYASQRPSGENWLPASKNGDSMNGKGLRSPNRGRTQRSSIRPLGPGRHVKQEPAVGGQLSGILSGIIREQHVLGACPAGRLLIQIKVPLWSMRRRRGGHRATRSTPIHVHSP